jgi:hypothetical protein
MAAANSGTGARATGLPSVGGSPVTAVIPANQILKRREYVASLTGGDLHAKTNRDGHLRHDDLEKSPASPL